MTESSNSADLLAAIRDLARDSHSSHVLTTAAMIEDQLMNAIMTKMRPDLSKRMRIKLLEGYGPLSSFSAKIDMAFALGFLSTASQKDFHLAREIRNAFAHPKDRPHFHHPQIIKLLQDRLPTSKIGVDGLATFNQLAVRCLTSLAPIFSYGSLLDALRDYAATRPTSPEISVTLPGPHPAHE